MEHITKFLECLAPVTVCNLECEYCYIIQQDRREMKDPQWDYDTATVAKALSVERLGGSAYISICGAGETLVSDQVIELAYLLLKEGHAVNITTNGTLSKKFDQIISTFPKECLERLHFAFSFHYLELKKKNLLNAFFDNIDKIKRAGCSFVVQLNLYDGYMPYIDEIKKISVERTGALPQIALTRKDVNINGTTEYEIHTNMGENSYIEAAKKFDSPLFECTLKNFNVKRKEFCYAGLWSGVLDLKTGDFRQCYAAKPQNIFKDLSKPIEFKPIGKNCPNRFCINSSHFMSLGVIPEIIMPSYEALRNREEAGWYNEKMKSLLSEKLYDNNQQYSFCKKLQVQINAIPLNIKKILLNLFPNTVKKAVSILHGKK